MYLKYQKAIIENLSKNSYEWDFKSNRYYIDVLEHVTPNDGLLYLEEIKKFDDFYNKNKEYLINICLINDLYGKTIKTYFNDFCECSPTNLRYILHSLLIIEHIKKCSLNNVDIVEIGGGYGGLCFFLYKLCKLFSINIKSYTIFDLIEPMELQKKYLKIHDINIETINISDDFELNNNCFLISNYAFSEISIELQNVYINKLINKYISNGFLAWNNIDVYDFIEGKNIVKEVEYPLTGNENYYVYF
jgi:hypothetical protein